MCLHTVIRVLRFYDAGESALKYLVCRNWGWGGGGGVLGVGGGVTLIVLKPKY